MWGWIHFLSARRWERVLLEACVSIQLSLRKPNPCPHSSGLLLDQQPPFLHTLSGQHLPSSHSHRKSGRRQPLLEQTLRPRPEPAAAGGLSAAGGAGRGQGRRGWERGGPSGATPPPPPEAEQPCLTTWPVNCSWHRQPIIQSICWILLRYIQTSRFPKDMFVPPEQNGNVSVVNCCDTNSKISKGNFKLL